MTLWGLESFIPFKSFQIIWNNFRSFQITGNHFESFNTIFHKFNSQFIVFKIKLI